MLSAAPVPLLLLLAASMPAQEDPARIVRPFRIPPQPVSTFSIVAWDPGTGQMGVAVQSHWFSVGSVVPWAEAGVGAVATQSFVREAYGPELLSDLRQGIDTDDALEARVEADPGRDVRQVAVVDSFGRVEAWTGKSCIASAANITGDHFSVQANIMRDDGVVPAMAEGYRNAKGDFAERLLQALEAAQLAGGDLRGRQSAALLIVSSERQKEPWQGVLVDLRVDDNPRPLQELRRLLRIQRAYDAANEGDLQLEKGNTQAALRAYAKASAIYPEQQELVFWRAVTLIQTGHEKEAFPLLAGVFDREPAWRMMPPRLVAAGQLPDDPALLKRLAGLGSGPDLRTMLDRADPGRIEKDIRTLAGFGTRHTLSDTKDPRRGIGAARRWLAGELESISGQFHQGRLKVELIPHRVAPGKRVPQGAEVVNVVATLPGSDPDRLVVLSGHYDSRRSDPMDASGDSPGANDDGSGTAAVLEAARLLGGLKPRATLVFLCVAGEEQGLLGAAAQAKLWKEQGKTVEAMFTMDIVGGATGTSGEKEPWRLRVFSQGIPSKGPRIFGSNDDAPSRQLARYFKRAGEDLVPGFEITLIFRQDRYLRGGDHRPFFEMGWPAVRLTEPHENYAWQHQDVRVEDGTAYGDVPENVDFAYVSRVARAVSAAAGELALAPQAPAGVQVDASHLTPDTRLLWKPNPEQDLAGYTVLYRRTDEPDWTHRVEAGDETEIVLEKISKDDWLFAVEAVDRAGHRSLPVYPAPKFR